MAKGYALVVSMTDDGWWVTKEKYTESYVVDNFRSAFVACFPTRKAAIDFALETFGIETAARCMAGDDMMPRDDTRSV